MTETLTKKDASICERKPIGETAQLSAVSCCETQPICCGKIRELAYKKWQDAGSPVSDGVSFWLEAEQELQNAE